MRPQRDLVFFAVLVVVFSLAIGAVVQPLVGADALVGVAAASVMLSARRESWPRKIYYAVITIVGSVAFVRWYAILGLPGLVAGDTSGLRGIAASMVYIVFMMAFPLAMLLVFVGRDPAVLWTGTPSQSEPHQRPDGRTGRRDHKRRSKR